MRDSAEAARTLHVRMWLGPFPFSSVEDGGIADITAAALRPKATLGRDVCKLCISDGEHDRLFAVRLAVDASRRSALFQEHSMLSGELMGAPRPEGGRGRALPRGTMMTQLLETTGRAPEPGSCAR